MLKKRIIFTLLYIDGFFYQSRNFNLQKVGDVQWLKKNYNFQNISFFIDELIILNISRNEKNLDKFITVVKQVSEFSCTSDSRRWINSKIASLFYLMDQ